MPTSRELFLSQCKRRFNARNPERMRLEHWEWMVRHGGGPYGVRQGLGREPNDPRCRGDDGCGLPDLDRCFSRFGMTRTVMSDGRIIKLLPGQSYQVADGAEPQRSRSEGGARVFIVD